MYMYRQKDKTAVEDEPYDLTHTHVHVCVVISARPFPLVHIPTDSLTHHVLVIVKVLDSLLGTADLVVIPLGRYVEIVE